MATCAKEHHHKNKVKTDESVLGPLHWWSLESGIRKQACPDPHNLQRLSVIDSQQEARIDLPYVCARLAY